MEVGLQKDINYMETLLKDIEGFNCSNGEIFLFDENSFVVLNKDEIVTAGEMFVNLTCDIAGFIGEVMHLNEEETDNIYDVQHVFHKITIQITGN